MPRLMFSLILSAAVASICASPADARKDTRTKYGNCYWDGTSPFCAGSCRSGFYVRGRQACMSGWKVKCCEPMGSVSQY